MSATVLHINRHTVLHRRRVRVLIIACVVVIAVAAPIAYTLAPVWFHLPVTVQINRQPYKVKSGTDALTFLKSKFNLANYQGVLQTDEGAVLDPKGGEPAQIRINGHKLRAKEKLIRNEKISLEPGGAIVHVTALKYMPVPPKAQLQGKGALIALSRRGQAGEAVQVVDIVTGKVLRSNQIKAPQNTVLQAHETLGIAPKVIALTFDDGPNDGETQAILGVLQQQQVKATFFELGVNIKSHPALSKACTGGGNLVALHSWDHKDFVKLTADQVTRQLTDSQAQLKAATGHTTRWFRFPYGSSNPDVDALVAAQNMRMAFWTVDTKDWTRPGAVQIAANALKGARPGAIILMHDGGGDRSQTVAALPQIITALKAQGYTFVTVEELYTIIGGK